MANKDKYYIKISDDHWLHRSPIKCLINPILRKLQFYTNNPYIIASKTLWEDGTPHFNGYKFTRVLYRK